MLNIIIADLNFVIRSSDVPLLAEPPSAAYVSFMSDEVIRNPRAPTVDVDLKTKELPSLEGFKEVFEGIGAWSMFRNGNEYYLVLNPSMEEGPECIARFTPAFEGVDIYCGKIAVVEKEGRKMIRNPFSYPLDQLLLMYLLAEKGGAILHAAGIEMHGRGFLFAGRSGAGKSTIIRQFAAAGKGILLSDDRIAVRKADDLITAYGTPWPGEAGIAENRGAPLSGIFFLEQRETDAVKKIGPREAFERLMPVTSVPWYDAGTMTKVLLFCEGLVSAVPAYELSFRPAPDIVTVFEEFVAG